MTKLSKEEEKNLINEAKSSVAAFGRLYDIYFDSIYVYVRYKVNTKEDAEDIVSDVFVKAMKNLKGFEWRGFSFSAWLYKIAHNLVVDYYRKSKKKKAVSLETTKGFLVDELSESPELQAQKGSDIGILLDMLARMPDTQREVVYLRYIKDLSIEETVEVTGKSVDSVKSLAKRGLAYLRENFKKLQN